LVENEDIIGTLIETNERLITAIEMYESMAAAPNADPGESVEIAKALANVHLTRSADGNDSSPFDDDEDNDNENNNIPGTRSNIPSSPPVHIHPDLEDLTFGSLNKGSGGGKSTIGILPEPLKPSFPTGSAKKNDDNDPRGREDREIRASLSDFSDYESSSSDGKSTNRKGFSRNHVTVSDNGDEGEEEQKDQTKSVDDDDDPFADPFADG